MLGPKVSMVGEEPGTYSLAGRHLSATPRSAATVDNGSAVCATSIVRWARAGTMSANGSSTMSTSFRVSPPRATARAAMYSPSPGRPGGIAMVRPRRSGQSRTSPLSARSLRSSRKLAVWPGSSLASPAASFTFTPRWIAFTNAGLNPPLAASICCAASTGRARAPDSKVRNSGAKPTSAKYPRSAATNRPASAMMRSTLIRTGVGSADTLPTGAGGAIAEGAPAAAAVGAAVGGGALRPQPLLPSQSRTSRPRASRLRGAMLNSHQADSLAARPTVARLRVLVRPQALDRRLAEAFVDQRPQVDAVRHHAHLGVVRGLVRQVRQVDAAIGIDSRHGHPVVERGVLDGGVVGEDLHYRRPPYAVPEGRSVVTSTSEIGGEEALPHVERLVQHAWPEGQQRHVGARQPVGHVSPLDGHTSVHRRGGDRLGGVGGLDRAVGIGRHHVGERELDELDLRNSEPALG